MEYIYSCKKNGLEYLYTTTVEFAEPQDSYAWRRGVREYADNYHASVTKKDWDGTDEEFAAEIDRYCTEARDRFHAGDVPGERAPSADKTKLVSLAARARKMGVDPVKMLEQFLAEQESAGRAA